MSRVPVAGDYLMDRQRAEELLGDLRRSGEVFIVGMVEMWRGQGWLALGYSSWDDLCDSELRGMRVNLPIESRREVVAELTDEGMSTRAIGSALGLHHDTVASDRKAGVGNPTPDPTPTVGLDGKTYQPRPTREVTTSETVTVDAETGEIVPPAPSKPHRRPLPDAMRDASHELLKSAQRLERLTSDDRWPRNAKQATAMTRGDLLQAIEALTTVLDRLDQSASAA